MHKPAPPPPAAATPVAGFPCPANWWDMAVEYAAEVRAPHDTDGGDVTFNRALLACYLDALGLDVPSPAAPEVQP